MSDRLKSLMVICFIALAIPAIAQKRIASPLNKEEPRGVEPVQRIASPDDGKVASVEEPDFTRFRVVTDDGVLVVYDADEEWDGRDEPFSQLAYWHDYASESLFFFDQLLFDSDDVLQSIATMQRDLQIDPAQVLSEKPELNPLPEITFPGQWRPAVEEDVLAVMAGGSLGAREGGVSGDILPSPCAPGPCPDPEAMAMSGALGGPMRGTPKSQLFASAQRGARCNCTGGGGGCGGCQSTDPCFDAVCDPDLGCIHVSNCQDVDECTMAQCIHGPTGSVCRTDSFCAEQCCGQYGWCCLHDQTCCEFNQSPAGCCPPDKPYCCNNGSLDTSCCPTEADCCNGDCKGPCDTVCGLDGWHEGPPCGSTWCAPWQVCCNGSCCGLGPCYTPECFPQGICVNSYRCDDGNECTDDPCTAGQCAAYTCEMPTNNSANCESDGNPCTYDTCVNGFCTHPDVPNENSCTSDGNSCTQDICMYGDCVHLPLSDGTGCAGDDNECTDDYCVGGHCRNVPVPDETGCSDDDSCTGPDACYGGSCIGPMCTGPCCDGECCAIDEECCGGSCCLPENCCENTCCGASENQTAGAICNIPAPCEPVCTDGDICTRDRCNQHCQQCRHTKRVDLKIHGNTNPPAFLDEALEGTSPGKIMCVDAGVFPLITISVDLGSVPAANQGSVRLELTEGANTVEVYATAPNATPTPQPITLPFTWNNPFQGSKLEKTLYLKPVAPGAGTIKATWLPANMGGDSCADKVDITVRPLWSSDDFPQMTFTPSNAEPRTELGAPTPGRLNNEVGFGFVGDDAITWDPEVNAQANGSHVACNQFTIGVVQNLLATAVTYVYSDGSLQRTADYPSLDGDGRAPLPFYMQTCSKTLTQCGSTDLLRFFDRPAERDRLTNPCTTTHGPLQSVSYQKNFETWLVAKHNPSGCFVVLKHFTWGQTAQSRTIIPFEGDAATTESDLDSDPGTTPKLVKPYTNDTARRACPE